MQDFDTIETPENVELQRRLAGIGSRFLAGLIDTLLISLLYLVIFLILLPVGVLDVFAEADSPGSVRTWALAVLILIGFSIYWGYFVLFEMLSNGQSPGKRYIRIRVVQQEGHGITFSSIAIRNLLRAVDMLGAYAVAGIAMFVTSKAQRLGDLAAGTVVISEAVCDYSSRYDKKRRVSAEREVTAGQLEASGLSPEQYRILRNYWDRRQELDIAVRRRLLPQLLNPVLAREGRSASHEPLEALEEYVEKLMLDGEGAGRAAEPAAEDGR